MTTRMLTQALATSGLLAVGLGVMPVVRGQEPVQRAGAVVRSLAEPDQVLALRATPSRGKLTTFASAAGRGIMLPGMAGAGAADRAMAFVDLYGGQFGVRSRIDVRPLRAPRADSLGLEHVRLQQLHDGVPVTAGELIVHLRGNRVMAANGHALSEFPPTVVPEIAPGTAQNAAAALIAKYQPEQAGTAEYSDPRLEVFNRGMLDEGTHPTRLAWFVEARGEALREYIWVDATTGGILLNFSQLPEAKNRTVYNANLSNTLPGTLIRSEGGAATGIPDADFAYDFAGVTYDYYSSQHGRDSYDGAGAELRSSVRYRDNPAVAFGNAFWNGQQMVYGEGYASADDVVAHELTHAVTEYSAGLLYYNQSGALNESYSDIFGETVDLLSTAGGGNDTPGARWLLAEDLAGVLGVPAIRNMSDPTVFGDPGKLSDPQFVCSSTAWTNGAADRGGVHSNSGVPNHAFALMVDGGNYNGHNVTGIGLTKAGKIQYRALTTYLTSGSGFLDNANALNQSCSDLVGTAGITAGDCTQVSEAVLAVEMSSPLSCAGATPPPATFCPLGGSPTAVLSNGFESGGVWSASSTTSTQWVLANFFARTGQFSGFGEDVDVASDHRLFMTNPVVIPTGGRVYFDQAFEFENYSVDPNNYDGGVLEYSTNGTTWNDAGSMIDAGQAYNGTLDSGNVLGARTAFVRSSYGYTGTRLDVSSLAGQSVRFRFRVGTDSSVGSLGWFIDNFQIYSCSGVGAAPTTVADSYVTPFQTPLVTPAPGVLANDSSNGGGAMTAVLVSNATHGSASLNANGSFTYTPNAGFSGADSFTYRATNAVGPGNVATVTVTVSPAPGGPVPPSNLRVLAISGTTVTFTWTRPTSGPAPTGIWIEGGAAPGQVLGSLTLPLSDAVTVTLPPASWYVRVRTIAGSAISGPSNEVIAHLTTAVPPAAPTNLLGLVVGNTLHLSWKNALEGTPTTGGPTSSVVLNYSGPVSGSLPIGATERFSYVGVPAGTYTFTVQGTNAGGASPASAPVMLTFPTACSGAPQTPTNFLVFKSGSTVLIWWDPPAGGPSPTQYTLNVTGSYVGTFPTTSRAFSSPAPAGTYNLSIVADNPCGSSAPTGVQTITIP